MNRDLFLSLSKKEQNVLAFVLAWAGDCSEDAGDKLMHKKIRKLQKRVNKI